MNELELGLTIASYCASGIQGYRVYRKNKKIFSRNIKTTIKNLTSISFGELFLLYDAIKYMKKHGLKHCFQVISAKFFYPAKSNTN